MNKKLWALITLLCMLLTGVTVYIASSFKTSEQKAAEALPPDPSVLTASVEYRTLENTLPLVCSVDYSEQKELAVTNAPAGAQYTSIDITQGEELTNGSLVAEVNGEPVFILLGGFSFYRDLKLDDRGPDAQLLNDALVSLGYQLPRIGADINTVTEETYRALGVLYRSFGYSPIDKDSPIPASSFILLPQPATVISPPRSTGDLESEPLALLSSGQKELICKPQAGSLSPEATTGQELRLTGAGEQTYPVQVASSDSSAAGAAKDASASQPGQDTKSQDRVVTVQVPDETLGGQTRFNAELILSSSPQAGLVVPSSAIYSSDRGVSVYRSDGQQATQVPVEVTYSTNGYSMIQPQNEADLPEGSQVQIQTGSQ